MPATVHGCSYPTNAELMQLQRDLMPRYMEGRLGLDIMPFRNSDADRIIYNQPDIFRGLQAWRGLGKPARQTLTGSTPLVATARRCPATGASSTPSTRSF
jgi:hypothetical protein